MKKKINSNDLLVLVWTWKNEHGNIIAQRIDKIVDNGREYKIKDLWNKSNER